MTIIIIFWSVVLGIFFWGCSMFLKTIQSIACGAFRAIIEWMYFLVRGIVGMAVLGLLRVISIGIRTGELGDMIATVFLGVLIMLVVIALFGGLGVLVLNVIDLMVWGALYIISCLIQILEYLDIYVERAYVFFLKQIKQRVDLL